MKIGAKSATAKNKKSDFLHSDYFILAFGLTFGATAYFIFLSQMMMQVGTVITTGIFYILWGAIHHARTGDLHVKIILEYVLIATLAMALLLTLIFRS